MDLVEDLKVASKVNQMVKASKVEQEEENLQAKEKERDDTLIIFYIVSNSTFYKYLTYHLTNKLRSFFGSLWTLKKFL